MRILLDECVPAPLARLMADHQCKTVADEGWRGVKNGALLALAQREFDLLITSDQNIRYQQNLTGFKIAVLELSTNDFRRLRAAITLIRSALLTHDVGKLVRLEIP